MKKIEFENQTYYYDNGKFYDDCFTELSKKDSQALSSHYFSLIDLRTLDFNEFVSLANQMDNGENYSECVRIIEKGFEIYFDNRDYAKIMLPKLFRLYRLQNQSAKVAELWSGFWSKKTDRIESSALYVVLGAAYCDLNMPYEAEKYANRAYGLMNGKADAYLNNLYMRINALK